jgi:hypothetical protein
MMPHGLAQRRSSWLLVWRSPAGMEFLFLPLYSSPPGQFRIRLLSFKSFPIHHSLIKLPFDDTDNVEKEPTKNIRLFI